MRQRRRYAAVRPSFPLSGGFPYVLPTVPPQFSTIHVVLVASILPTRWFRIAWHPSRSPQSLLKPPPAASIPIYRHIHIRKGQCLGKPAFPPNSRAWYEFDLAVVVALVSPLGNWLTGMDHVKNLLLMVLLVFYLHQIIEGALFTAYASGVPLTSPSTVDTVPECAGRA